MLQKEIIETYWNVNIESGLTDEEIKGRNNRNILECK